MKQGERFCSVCRLGDGPLVPADFVVTAPDGAEWFECRECAEIGGHLPDILTLTPIEQSEEPTKC